MSCDHVGGDHMTTVVYMLKHLDGSVVCRHSSVRNMATGLSHPSSTRVSLRRCDMPCWMMGRKYRCWTRGSRRTRTCCHLSTIWSPSARTSVTIVTRYKCFTCSCICRYCFTSRCVFYIIYLDVYV